MTATVVNSIEFISHLSTEVLIVLFLIVGFAFASLYFGKDKIISFIISLFVGTFLFEIFPYEIGQKESAFVSFGGIIVLALCSTFVLRKFIHTDFPYKKTKKYLQAVVLGITGTITLFVTGLSSLYEFSSFITKWLEGDMLFWVSIIPFVLLLFFVKK
tara:strand:- start:190 stop:663 length:474 start_codon:yes stop_codon:yes gene_type:complete